MALPLACGSALAALVFARVTVAGESMLPTLEPGDRLLVLRFGHRFGLRRGDLVTVRDPRPDEGNRVLVKRIVEVENGRAALAGDNPAASTDSRTFGRVSVASVTGLVLYRYAPSGRSGALR